MKRFAFVMDPLEKLDLEWDTSLCLLRELGRRGHETILLHPPFLSSTGSRIYGWGKTIWPSGPKSYHREPFRKFELSKFSAVFIRKDPPFDPSYLALTYLLEPVAEKTLVINHPRGIRNTNEKLSALSPSRFSPPTLVSGNLCDLLGFQKKIRSDLVLKPLYEKGGKGVFLLKRRSPRKALLLKKALRQAQGPLAAQKFIAVPEGRGDKRILLWKGEILGAFERIPSDGEFRTNLSLGGRFARCEITQGEKALVRSLRSRLLKEGLLFVGIDVREGLLIEVNVTSPAGLVELDQLYGEGATARIAEDLERI